MMIVMQEVPNALNVIAPDCSSFPLVSRGTSLRSGVCPLGRDGIPFVHRANGSISRWGGTKKPFFYLYDIRMETDLNPLQGRSPDDFDGGLPHHLPYGTTKRF